MAGLSLLDPEPEPLIKREKGKWKGVEKYSILVDEEGNNNKQQQQQTVLSTVNTAKTTLAHNKASEMIQIYHKVSKFFSLIK